MSIHYPRNEHGEIDATIEDDGCIKFPERLSTNSTKCLHSHVEIDNKLNSLVCKKCNREVNAVVWIEDNLEYFRRMKNTLDEEKKKVNEDKAELERRARTRCVHCQKMTSINLKHHTFKIVK